MAPTLTRERHRHVSVSYRQVRMVGAASWSRVRHPRPRDRASLPYDRRTVTDGRHVSHQIAVAVLARAVRIELVHRRGTASAIAVAAERSH